VNSPDTLFQIALFATPLHPWLDNSSETEAGVMAVQFDGVLPNREQGSAVSFSSNAVLQAVTRGENFFAQ
jgi:hypothetical protein